MQYTIICPTLLILALFCNYNKRVEVALLYKVAYSCVPF